ncbi:MAG: alpha/beta hydrolase [Pseudomonadota bacterium]
MTAAVRHAEFIGDGTARLFLMAYAPKTTGPPRGCYVVAPAFAEEMNRTRDVLRRFGEEAAARGIATVIPDLRGTGDSPGDFGAFDLDDWCEDLAATVHYTRRRYGDVPVTMLGLRFGALLAARVVAELRIQALLLWQPVTEGRRLVREFLRVWNAANMGAGVDARDQVSQNGTLEVAGYSVDQRLIEGLEAMNFVSDVMVGVHLRWIEAGAALSARSQRSIETLRSKGFNVMPEAVQCPPFWRIQERVDATAFVSASFAGGVESLRAATVRG